MPLNSVTVAALVCASTFVSPGVCAASKTPAFDTRYIPRDTAAATVIRPAALFQRPIVARTIAAAKKQLGRDLAARLAGTMAENYAAPFADIDEIVILYNRAALRNLAYLLAGVPKSRRNADDPGTPHAPGEPFGIIRYRKPVDLKRVLATFVSNARPASLKRVHAGKTYYKAVLAACVVDPTTVLFGPEPAVKKMITANDRSSELAKLLLKTAPGDDAVFAAAGPPLVQVAANLHRDCVSPAIVRLLDALAKAKSIQAAGRLTGKTLITLRIEAEDAATAVSLADVVKNHLLPAIKRSRRQPLRAALAKPGEKNAPALMELLGAVLNDTRVGCGESRVTVEVPRPNKLDRLPEAIAPYLESLRVSDQIDQAKARLQKIGRAMQRYHKQHRRFPRHGSDHNGKGKGLSWRVHLLPFLGHQKLYRQFKLDEPWNSPHNRKLIARMPAAYRHNEPLAAGKTSLHVFVGRDAPFGGQGPGIRIADVTDGTSHTVLAVQAGRGKAATWTAPGGIVFNRGEDPWEELGRLPHGLLAVMLDGAVRRISKNAERDSLSNLIQHADGLTVGDD